MSPYDKRKAQENAKESIRFAMEQYLFTYGVEALNQRIPYYCKQYQWFKDALLLGNVTKWNVATEEFTDLT